MQASAAMQRQNGGRSLLARAAAVASGLLMVLAVAMVVQNDEGTRLGNGSEAAELSAAPRLQSLWESDDSVNHDPYFNVFSGSSTSGGNYGSAHKAWSKQVVRERVWQTLKDVKAMERHVREQNALNNKMKMQITTLEQEAQNEKEVIRKLIAAGMSDVTDKIAILKNAALANVTDVREMLARIEAEQKAKQAEQDTAIDQLTARHQELQLQTTTKFQQVDAQISAAEQRLAEAKARVASEREEVKKLILEKIKTDVGGLDKQMTDRLENEKYDIRTTIDGGLKQLDGNISDYSLKTGIRVARLMNKVAVLKKDQKEKADAQDGRIRSLEDDHKELKEQTLGTLATLRTEVDDTKKKLSQAQQTLEAEQALRQSAEEEALNKDTAKLHSATEQSLADAKDAVSLKIGNSNTWAHDAFAASKGAFHHSVDDLEKQLGDFVKATKESSQGQQQALQAAEATNAQQVSEVKQEAAEEAEQVSQTQAAVALSKAKLKGEVAEETKALRVKLLERMTALQESMATSLAQVRADLEGKMKTDNTALSSDLTSAKATATGVMDSVNADLLQTQTQAKASDDKSEAELADVAASEKALAASTGSEMTALKAEMDGLEQSVAQDRATLTAETASMEAALRGKLDSAFTGLNTSMNAAVLKLRADAEKKLSGEMTGLKQQISDAHAASEASAKTLAGKLSQVEAAAQSASAASEAQVAAVRKDHTDLEAHATTALANVKDSLANTKAALEAADASMQERLGQREASLKAEVEGQVKAASEDAVAKLNAEATAVKQAHDALAAALAAHQAATSASVTERKEKLEQLAADLQTLQAKMQAVEARSSKATLVAQRMVASMQLARSPLAVLKGDEAGQARAVMGQGKSKAEAKAGTAGSKAAGDAREVAVKKPGNVRHKHKSSKALPHDVAVRTPRALPMMFGNQKPRGEPSAAVQRAYYE